MIESFAKWFERNQQKLAENKVRVSISRKKRHEYLSFFTTVITEFETKKVIGNIILYISGECEIHVFSNDEKKEEIFIELHEPKSEDELFDLLKNTFEKITGKMF
jgi:hypothetical protein